MIDKSFVESITGLVPAATITIGGKEYATKSVVNPPLPTEPLADPLQVSTLTGLVDYCKAFIPPATDHVLHVRSFHEVALLSKIQGENRKRDNFTIANCGAPAFKFGAFIPHPEFMIAIQSQFEDFGDREKVMRVVGTIKKDAARTSMDDGVTQRVTASSGVTLVQDVAVPNPVMLKPYRTFREVDQPPSLFVLRVDMEEDEPQVALFEADGGRWKHEAISNIREYLAEATTGIVVVA